MSNAERTVLDWQVIDDTLPAAKAFGAAVGWGNSLVTNVLCCIWFEVASAGGWSWVGVVVGCVSWAILLGAQLYTVSRHEVGNIAASFPDIVMTAVPWYFVFVWFFGVLFGAAGPFLAGPCAWYLGVVSGRMPERLVLGKRPRGERPWLVRLLFL